MRLIYTLLLLTPLLLAEDFEKILEESYKASQVGNSSEFASNILEKYQGNEFQLTSKAFDFFKKNQQSRTLLNGFWRDIDISHDSRAFLIEKLILGSSTDADIAWQFLELSDQAVTQKNNGEKAFKSQLPSISLGDENVPLEYRAYLFRQNAEQAVKYLQKSFTESEEEILNTFHKHNDQLNDLGGYDVWITEIAPKVKTYLESNPSKSFTEYIIARVGGIYSSPLNAEDNNKEVISLCREVLGDRIVGTQLRGYLKKEEKTNPNELKEWLRKYRDFAPEKPTSFNNEGRPSPQDALVFKRERTSELKTKEKETKMDRFSLVFIGLPLLAIAFFVMRAKSKD